MAGRLRYSAEEARDLILDSIDDDEGSDLDPDETVGEDDIEIGHKNDSSGDESYVESEDAGTDNKTRRFVFILKQHFYFMYLSIFLHIFCAAARPEGVNFVPLDPWPLETEESHDISNLQDLVYLHSKFHHNRSTE